MIYLYAGLGMAMMLPIMVGLQMAISVAEIEQGELAMQKSDGKVSEAWKDAQGEIKKYLEKQKQAFVPPICLPLAECKNFDFGPDKFASNSTKPEYKVYQARFYSPAWAQPCLVPVSVGKPDEKCPKEP